MPKSNALMRTPNAVKYRLSYDTEFFRRSGSQDIVDSAKIWRPERFERPPPRFVVQKYLFAAFLNCTLLYDENSTGLLF